MPGVNDKDRILADALATLAGSGLGDKSSRDLIAGDLADVAGKRVEAELGGAGREFVDRQAAAAPKAKDVMSQVNEPAPNPDALRSALLKLKKQAGGGYGPR